MLKWVLRGTLIGLLCVVSAYAFQVKAIEVKGLERIPESTVLHAFPIQVGQDVDQAEITKALRYAVGGQPTEMGQLLYDQLGVDRCLEVYAKIGEFLMWPKKAVDERLFLEWVFARLTNGTEGSHGRT